MPEAADPTSANKTSPLQNRLAPEDGQSGTSNSIGTPPHRGLALSGSAEKVAAHRFLHRLQERKYFDSGDYAMLKQAAASGGSSPVGSPLMVGKLHPSPDRIPRSQSGNNIGQSPMKEHVVSSENLSPSPPQDGDDNDAADNVQKTIAPRHHPEDPPDDKGSGLAQ